MYFLSWIIVGLVAGWSAGKILKGNGYGPLMDIVIGIGGAVAGGILRRCAGLSRYRWTIYSTFSALIIAIRESLIAGLPKGRRIVSRLVCTTRSCRTAKGTT